MIDCIESYPLQPVFSVEQIREIERQLFALEKNSFVVMQQAGAALLKNIVKAQSQMRHVTILVGGGNNGGDGLVLAALLVEAGFGVRVFDCATRKRHGDALKAYKLAQSKEVEILSFEEGLPFWGGVVVDGLLGIGVELPLRKDVLPAVHWINEAKEQGAFVVAIDMPTGVDADTGFAEHCVQADMTVCMVQRKRGNFLGEGVVASGKIINESLGSTALLPEDSAMWLDASSLSNIKPCPRLASSHKGSYGHVIVFGGDFGYGGAAIMASEAASKAGAGTIALVTRGQHISASLTRNPNVMAVDEAYLKSFEKLVRNNTSIVLGPGLGREAWGEQVFRQAIDMQLPTVIDADGLYWLSRMKKLSLPEVCVLTPHPGEAAKLLGWPIKEVVKAPIEASLAIAKKFTCTLVLKGVASVVANSQGNVYITGQSQPVLSKGGSGDVLSGLLGATLAYYKKPTDAALLAVAWHNQAAGQAAQDLGERRAQSYDLLNYLD